VQVAAEIPLQSFRAIRMLWTAFCLNSHRVGFESSQYLHIYAVEKGKIDDEHEQNFIAMELLEATSWTGV